MTSASLTTAKPLAFFCYFAIVLLAGFDSNSIHAAEQQGATAALSSEPVLSASKLNEVVLADSTVSIIQQSGSADARATLTLDFVKQALKDVLHYVNEIGALLKDFWKLILRDPLDGILQFLNFLGELLGIIDSGDGVAGDLPIPGPGIGNLAYSAEELFQPIGWVNHDNGVPGIYAGRKPYGTNLGMMIDGYFFTLFAPDSGAGPGGFLLLDVADPHNPKLMKRIYEPEGSTGKFREPHAFGLTRVNGRRYMAFQNISGVEFWDFTDLNNLQPVSELSLPNVKGGDYSNVSWQLSWQAPYLYVASSEQGIFIVDTSDPQNPALVKSVPASALGGFRVGPIFAFGNHLVLTSMDNRDGVASLDISDPLNPQMLDRVPDLDQIYYASCFDGKRLALSVRGADAKMVLFDLADPAKIELQDDQLAVSGQLYCAFQDQFVFQGTEDWVHKIDLSDPQNPVDLGSGTIAGPLVRLVDHGQVSPMGNLIFIGNDHGTGSAFMPHDVAPDFRPPQVSHTLPHNGAQNQSTLSRVGIAFTDMLDFSSVNQENIQIADSAGQVVSGTYSLENNKVNFAPELPLLPNTTYHIRVRKNGVRDTVGNSTVDEFVATFSTGAGSNTLDLNVNLEVASTVAISGEVALFDASVVESVPGLEYRWSFGDGVQTTFSSTPSAQHEYQNPGHYQVTLFLQADSQSQRFTFTRTVINEPTPLSPSNTASIRHTEGSVVVVNPDNSSVTAFDSETLSKRWETAVGASPQTLAVGPDKTLWVAVRDADEIVVLSSQGAIVQRIALAYGAQPYGITFAPNNAFALVSLSGTGELLKISPSGEPLARLTLKDPRSIAIDWQAAEAWVTRFIAGEFEAAGALQAQVFRVALGVSAQDSMALLETIVLDVDTTTVDSQDRARGVPNYLFDISISPDGLRALIPSKKDNVMRGVFRDGQTLLHDRTVRAIVSEINLQQYRYEVDQEIDFDNRSSARSVLFSPHGDYVFVALQGSNKIAVLDAYSQAVRAEIETDFAPQSMAIDSQGQLFVHNFMGRSVSVFDVSEVLASKGFSVLQRATLATVAHEQLSDSVLQGKRIFYNANDPRMSRESYISCASCHVDGGQDGMVWDFTERGEGLRNTITLEGRAGLGHGNVHWTANFDEIQDFEHDIRGGFGGTGFLTDEQFAASGQPLGAAKAGLNSDLDALADYVASLATFSRNPNRTSDQLTLIEQGEMEFVAAGCNQCHSGAQFTDGQRHILETRVPGSGNGMGQPLNTLGIETPTLRGVWNTAPYFHHGQVSRLRDVLLHEGHGNAQGLSESKLDALEAYLRAL